jgi:uncharacterized protein (TIGR02996 family)
MTIEDAFLQAILENLDDDFPRLVLADWLEEHDDPRGEFIHIQCRLARMDADDAQRDEMEAREGELLRLHQDEWLGTIRPLLSGWTFRRGFLDAMSVRAAVYLAEAEIPRPATVRTFEVDLTGIEVPQEVIEYIPESVARENILLPIGFRRGTLVLATIPNPKNALLMQKMEFILNRDLEQVTAPLGHVIEAISRFYSFPAETAAALSRELTDSVATRHDPSEVARFAPRPSDAALAARLVHLIIAEAVWIRGTECRLEGCPVGIRVLYRTGDEWIKRATVPIRFRDGIFDRVRLLAGIASEIDGDQPGRIRWTENGSEFDIEVVFRIDGERTMILLRAVPSGSEWFA